MGRILITGANRGLGLEFARQYLADGWHVDACCREPETATELAALPGPLRIHKLDVKNEHQISALAAAIGDAPLDILLNNAGTARFDDRFGETDTAPWLEILYTNAIAPLHMAEKFLSLLQRGQHKRIVNISSRMGSIADNTGGGNYAYRSSKAALNMVAKSMAIDLRDHGVSVITLHPGWVKTRMGGQHASLTPLESVQGMRRVIASATLAESGGFFDYQGKPIPW